MQRLHIVLIHRYFRPDTPPYAHILYEIADQLGRVGHQVTVLTCQPSYNRSVVSKAPAREELPHGVEVRRWGVLPDRKFGALKGINLVIFCLRILRSHRELGNVDVVMAASTPPIAVAKVASWVARRRAARFVYHKQDIYPEVMAFSGMSRRSRTLVPLLRRLDAQTDRSAARVVVLSEDMATTVQERGVSPANISVINNFDPWNFDPPAVIEGAQLNKRGRVAGAEPTQRKLNVAFAGNLGRFQNLESVMEAVKAFRDDDRVSFHFFGDGALRSQLQTDSEAAGLRNVAFYGYQSPDVVGAFLRDQAHLAIVSLVPGVVRAAYPSKTLSYLRQGCPVLALVEADSELARDVVTSRAGVNADPNDPDSIVSALRLLADNPRLLDGAGDRAAALYRARFSKQYRLNQWIDLFEDVGSRRGT